MPRRTSSLKTAAIGAADYKERFFKLCRRLGVSEDKINVADLMLWASVGFVLALHEPEFQNSGRRGRKPGAHEERDADLQVIEAARVRAKAKAQTPDEFLPLFEQFLPLKVRAAVRNGGLSPDVDRTTHLKRIRKLAARQNDYRQRLAEALLRS